MMRWLPLVLAGLAVVSGCSGTGPRAQDLGVIFSAPVVPARPQVARSLRADISPDNPARMLVIGDSLADGFGQLLRDRSRARGLPITVSNRGRSSTGLSRTDFYNWPQNFAAMAAEYRPDIVVAHFGANDMQSVIAPDGRTSFGTDAWEDAYAEQFEMVLDVAARNGAMLWVLGPATDRRPNLNAHLARVNPIFEREAAAAGAVYLPLRPFTSGPNGEFAQVVGGQRIRTGDGSHFNGLGYRIVADRVLDDITARAPQVGPQSVASVLASVPVFSVFALQ